MLSFDGDHYRMQVCVEDTGIGVTDEQKSRLFKSFEQAEANTSRKFGGTRVVINHTSIDWHDIEARAAQRRPYIQKGHRSTMRSDGLLHTLL